MSATTYTLTLIDKDAAALTRLQAMLCDARDAAGDRLAELLPSVFGTWDQPRVLSVSLFGNTLRCKIDASAHDTLEPAQILALQAVGPQHLKVTSFNSQDGEASTRCFKDGKPIAAKAFPQPMMSEGDRLLVLVQDAKDAALVKEIKGGASPNAIADGEPLVLHALRAGMLKAAKAMVDAGLDWSACLPWAPELADLIRSSGDPKAAELLGALLRAPGANLPELARLHEVMGAVSQHPKLLRWLLAEPGVDVNARLKHASSGQETGSLLFHSVEFFDDRADVLKVLTAADARSVAPLHASDADRLHRLLRGYRDAESLSELRAAGVDLETSLRGDDSPLLSEVMRHYGGSARERRLVLELLDAHVRADFWLAPKTFVEDVLVPLLDVYRFTPTLQHGEVRSEFDAEAARSILAIVEALLARGLDANLRVALQTDDLRTRHDAEAPPTVFFSGNLVSAVGGLLCVRGSLTRALCLPLVELLVSHGASCDTPCERSAQGWQRARVWTWGNWPELGEEWLEGSSLSDHLRRRQAQAPDEVDAALLALMPSTADAGRLPSASR